jgi:hypothetical protein
VQPIAPKDTKRTSSPIIASQLRRRLGIPQSSSRASAVPPVDGQISLLIRVREIFVAVEVTVSVEVCGVVSAIVTDVGMRLHVN